MKKLVSVILVVFMMFNLCCSALAVTPEEPFENSMFYDFGDYTLHYRVFDSEGACKNQIMLIHGFCLSTVSLEGVAQEYAKNGYRVVLVDSPNFGYSSRESSSTSLLSREELIGALMTHLGGKWIVGGHSMGGGIAVNLACDYPDAVTGLILFAPQTSVQADTSHQNPILSLMMQKIYNTILGFCLRFPFLVRLFVSLSFSDSAYAKDYDLSRVTGPLSVSGTGAGIYIMTTHTRGADFARLSSIDIPCVIITAKNDKVAMADNLKEIIDSSPVGTEIFEFEKGGHMMMEYAPAEVVAKTLPIIEKCN